MKSVALRCLSGIRGQSYARAARLAPRGISLRRQAWPVRSISQLPPSEHTSQDRDSNNGPSLATGSSHPNPTLVEGLEAETEGSAPFPPATPVSQFTKGAKVTVHGFLDKRRDTRKNLTFCRLETHGGGRIQIVSQVPSGQQRDPAQAVHDHLRRITPFSPVAITGILSYSGPGTSNEADDQGSDKCDPAAVTWDLQPTQIQVLNKFSRDIIVSKDAVWSPAQRHLQIRFDGRLRQRLQLRSDANFAARKYLASSNFHEFETPVLFKSTPEGAREFLVPTRQRGHAYALPQSPQQCKQVLMAAGIRKYFQFARCFRDEDSRADRQPEFTQLDLEMSFATGNDVIETIESIISSIFASLRENRVIREVGGRICLDPWNLTEAYAASPVTPAEGFTSSRPLGNIRKTGFKRISYDSAMSKFGSDKPDLRIPSQIQQIGGFLPSNFVTMITHLEDPIVEAVQFKLTGTPYENMDFIRDFMDNLPKTPLKLQDGSTPGIFIFDKTKPLNGLAAFGHEAGGHISALQNKSWPRLEHGDLLIVHARENVHFQGEGWTDLGRLRKAIYDAAVQQGLMERDVSFKFCWINDFPLFTPDVEPGEGQGGAAGLKATHHPFTAPLKPFSPEDLAAIAEGRPWEVKADHYDLVLNGTEVGGGSRRVHQRTTQEYIMRRILKMPESGIKQFEHLLNALDAGCPPHAGFALGWDRFMTLLCDVESVRDVIAFPKNQKGEDVFSNSPSQLTKDQLETYHLAPRGWALPDAKH